MRYALIFALLSLPAWAQVACPTPAGTGTAYYINPSTGNDSNNGTSTGTPWKSWANVTANTFNPDDVICVKSYGDITAALYGEAQLTDAHFTGLSLIHI